MVSSGRQIIVPLLLLLSAVVCVNAQPAVDKGSTSTISGKVTLGDKGVPGLVVGLAISTPSSSTYITHLKAVTDEEGNYKIKNVPPVQRISRDIKFRHTSRTYTPDKQTLIRMEAFV